MALVRDGVGACQIVRERDVQHWVMDNWLRFLSWFRRQVVIGPRRELARITITIHPGICFDVSVLRTRMQMLENRLKPRRTVLQAEKNLQRPLQRIN